MWPVAMTRPLSRPSSQEAGVTLIEFVVMLAVLAIVIGGIYEFVVNGAVSAAKTNDFVQSQGQIRAALDNIIDASRWAQSDTEAGPASITPSIHQYTTRSAHNH